MKKIIIISIFFVIAILFHAAHAAAANWYVRAGAAGDNSGTDWTNAYTSLPAALVRGDTYYIADGTYPSYTVDDAVSGTLYITIKKATISDHGTNTGWNDSYGDGQAVFTEDVNNINGSIISIITSYVNFDGVVGAGAITGVNGSGSDPNTYGFKIIPANCNRHNRLLGVPPVGYYSTLNISNVAISHVAFINCGSDYDSYVQSGIYSFPLSGSNMTVSYNYFNNSSSNMTIRKWKNSTISYNYFDKNWWTYAANSSQQISPGENCDDIILSNNIFYDSGVFVLGVHHSTDNQGNKRWKIYNNIIAGGTGGGGQLSGIFVSAETTYNDVVINFEIHHNTMINTSGGTYGAVFVGDLTDVNFMKSYAYNNLFYNVEHPKMNNAGYITNAIDHTHNAHFNSTGTYDSSEGGTAQVGTGDPFVDSVNNNFHLKAPTDAGETLNSPYDIDADGNHRGADGVWDRGAYEYCSSGNCTGGGGGGGGGGGDTGGNGGNNSSGDVSGGSGCGFVKDNGKGQKAKGEGLAFAMMLIITLAGIAIARRVFLLRKSTAFKTF